MLVIRERFQQWVFRIKQKAELENESDSSKHSVPFLSLLERACGWNPARNVAGAPGDVLLDVRPKQSVDGGVRPGSGLDRVDHQQGG